MKFAKSLMEFQNSKGETLTEFHNFIDADHDYITCPNCRVCVPRGQACGCNLRTLGPATENTTRQILTGEPDAERR